MKNVCALLLLYCFSVTAVIAQEGTVLYEETIKLDIELPPEMQAMAQDFPTSQSSKQMLYFNESASLYKAAEEQDNPGVQNFSSEEGVEIRISRSGNDNQTFVDFDEGVTIEKKEFLGKNFLITGTNDELAWKLTNEQSEFLGYMCMKATAQRDSTTYEAWFTPEISVPTGPGQGGLPGLILVLNVDGGERTYVAKELSLAPVEEGLITPPKKGKKVTSEEFVQIVEERMKEMNATRSGTGVFLRMGH